MVNFAKKGEAGEIEKTKQITIEWCFLIRKEKQKKHNNNIIQHQINHNGEFK